jgi:hypothetical protein
MSISKTRLSRAALVAAAIGLYAIPDGVVAQNADLRVEEALQNITVLIRPGRVGYATLWDGNKYIQCRRWPDRAMRCESAGTLMQPSLRNVLTGERLNRLAALGWVLDPRFGNYVKTFPADAANARIANDILGTLSEAYEADSAGLEIETTWVADMPCPPRNGPAQNLAGIVNDAPSMRPTAVTACSYVPGVDVLQKASSAVELITLYGATVTAEIQRLRINARRKVYVVFDASIGYIQCMPETPSITIYCEAQSAESWAALAAILTPERVALLHKTGYSDPGRAPNYWKSYSLDKYNDAAMASEILTVLHDVYGYVGATKLKIKTE